MTSEFAIPLAVEIHPQKPERNLGSRLLSQQLTEHYTNILVITMIDKIRVSGTFSVREAILIAVIQDAFNIVW